MVVGKVPKKTDDLFVDLLFSSTQQTENASNNILP